MASQHLSPSIPRPQSPPSNPAPPTEPAQRATSLRPSRRSRPTLSRRFIDIDTIGTFNTVKATIPHLVASAAKQANPSPSGVTGGRILAVSATFHYTGVPLQSHVSAAKAAVDSLMGSVSLEYGPLGVTANVIAPGAIAGNRGHVAAGEQSCIGKETSRGIPSGRMGTVRDIADATVFLFSDAGNYVNGAILPVRRGPGGGANRLAWPRPGHELSRLPDSGRVLQESEGVASRQRSPSSESDHCR